MKELTLETFFGAAIDFESTQYRVRSALQGIRREFVRNRIYPTLAQLIELQGTLQRISKGGRALHDELPYRVIGLDFEQGRLITEPVNVPGGDIEAIRELIDWALPEIITAIEEGKVIYNFVDENMRVERVGIVPTYVEEGYLLLPERNRDLLHIIRYEVTIFTGPEERYRNLKTSTVSTVKLGPIAKAPAVIKQELMDHYRDLPNPATYYFDTDLDFPFQQALLPVAKRKLLRQLYS